MISFFSDIMLNLYVQATGGTIENNKAIKQALGIVINNCTDWKNGKQVR